MCLFIFKKNKDYVKGIGEKKDKKLKCPHKAITAYMKIIKKAIK